MDKFVKILSTESGEITATDNLRNFRIPQGESYSLRDSYINFNCSVDIVDAPAQGGTNGGSDGVYGVNVSWNETAKPLAKNIALVKNASLRSSMKGNIENLRRVDILKENLAVLDKSVGESRNESYIDISQIINPINIQRYGLFTQYNKTGAIKSETSRNVPISVRLSDIFQFCETDEYDTERGGGLEINLELNRDKLVADALVPNAEAVPTQFKRFMNVDTTGEPLNALVVGTEATQLRVQDLDQSPYYVGQKIRLQATGQTTGAPVVAPANIDKHCVIAGIEWDRKGGVNNTDQSKTGKMTLTFVENWSPALTAGQSYDTISCTLVAPASTTLRMNNAELVLKKLNESEKSNLDAINYTTFSCEEGSAGGSQGFQNLFTVEGEATQAFMSFTNGELLSNANLLTFRCALNNIDLTDRDVAVQSPLYYDRLSQSLRGMGYSLRDTHLNSGKTSELNWSDVYGDADNQCRPLVASLFRTESNKFLQVRTTAGANGLNNFQLFKAIPKVFSY
jgi:hypothetical protein